MEVVLKKAATDDIPILIDIEESIIGPKTYSPMLTEDEWSVPH